MTAVGGLGAALQAVEVSQVSSVGFDTGFGEGLDGPVAAVETEHLVAVAEQSLDDSTADKASGTCYDDTHFNREGRMDNSVKVVLFKTRIRAVKQRFGFGCLEASAVTYIPAAVTLYL